jgi:kynureninase
MLRKHASGNEEKQVNRSQLFNSKAVARTTLLADLLVAHPTEFMRKLYTHPMPLSIGLARELDNVDPLRNTAKEFAIGELIPFAGHSLGPLFNPVSDQINNTLALQTKLHAGHFSASHPHGQDSAHWFDCDRHVPALKAAKQILGFKEMQEFNFTNKGLSENLAMLMDTFYKPGSKDWKNGRTKIVILATEFFSDQAVVTSVIKRAWQTARNFGLFARDKLNPEDHIIRISPDANGIYSTDKIISTIRDNADKIKIICLSDIVFSTGQRLEFYKIFPALQQIIATNKIFVGVDLAHSVGNRPIQLDRYPIHFAVGCGYKHLCGPAGSAFGIYVNRNIDLEEFPPLQGWKAAASDRVFPVINQYDASIMSNSAALAFRASNPPPLALLPAQEYLTYFAQIGFFKCFYKSESLTLYLIAQLQWHLGDKIEFISPLDDKQRGAMLVFRVKDVTEINSIEHALKTSDSEFGKFEIDTRPPNNIRLTAHYGYTKFEHICLLVSKLKLVITNHLENKIFEEREHKCQI